MPAPMPCDAPVTTATFCSALMIPSFQIEDAPPDQSS
jgi:hypothetical protein